MSFWVILKAITIGPLELVYELIFSFAYQITNHLGLSIMVLSLVVNILVLPLYKRADELQEQEREKQKQLDPWVRHIKKTFKGDERTMILQTYYREMHYNPIYVLKSSVSLLLQIPFFIAAYQFLSGLHVLEGASFGPISNLGAEDALFMIGNFPVNVLPILMTVINIVSGMIYTKGHPLKLKLQLYGMALVFLVLLYRSPSGLVFYWTLNNVFSLGKNIVEKIIALARRKKAEKRALTEMQKAEEFCEKTREDIPETNQKKADRTNDLLFFLSGGFLSVLMGLYIPAAVIASSVTEFVDIFDLHHPVLTIIPVFCTALGLFVVWLGVFYLMADQKWRGIFLQILLILCIFATVNFMGFKTKDDSLSNILRYATIPVYANKMKLLNLLVLAFAAPAVPLIYRFKKGIFKALVPSGLLILSILSIVNLVKINKGYKQYDQVLPALNSDVEFNLSKDEKNVIVFMLDRSMGMYLPYIVKEHPELKEAFDGFTYYPNTVSFGAYTNFGAPALYGGYEYTPERMNQRADESLKDKHNEALLVMPVLFSENGFDVTVTDPPYANYSWVPDLSLYDSYPEIKSGVLEHRFYEEGALAGEVSTEIQKRNLFCYSFMSCSPVIIRNTLYNNGYYRKEKEYYEERDSQISQVTDGMFVAHGYNREFMDWYRELENLSSLTTASAKEKGSFLLITNGATHEPSLLQEPDYVPLMDVDNTAVYENADLKERFTVDDVTLRMDNVYQMIHYHANAGSLLQIAKWLETLKKLDVYDNTRIIIVADHGRIVDQMDLFTDRGDSMEYFLPLLLVKDYDATGFNVSDEFMTNADVAALASGGIIENPVNPFTGNMLDGHEKKEGDPVIFLSQEFSVVTNNGNQFLPGDWYVLHNGRPYEIGNWEYIGKTPERN